jgi:lipid A 3-O-deacylase
MKHVYLCRVLYLVILTIPLLAAAQPNSQFSQKMLRIYEDNDFINIRGKGTDEAYTNGTQIDFFYTKKQQPRFVITKLITAGDSSINIRGWGITHLMFTPRDISVREYQPNDYPYSAALFITHSLYSYNPLRRMGVQMEMMLGVRGPAAMGKQLQTFVHRLIDYQRPMGWDNQLPNKLVANIKFTVEKQLYAYKNILELNAGAEIYGGSLLNSAVIYPTIRFGKMNPYFDGLIAQYISPDKHRRDKKKNVQAYLLFKPGLTLTASNGLLQQGSRQLNAENKNQKPGSIRDAVWIFNGGAVLSINRFALSFNQNITAPLVHELYSHETGNLSFYIGL